MQLDGYRRTLIENIFPIEVISDEARKEKDGHPILFEIHHWWDRTPLIIARAAILAGSLPENYDVREFIELLGFNDYHKKHSHNYNLQLLQRKNLEKDYKKYWGLENLTVFDPFSGSGSIPFESLRMEFNTYSNEYDPLAYLIQKATIEYPKEYGEELLKDVTEYLNILYLQAEEGLKDLYPDNNGSEPVNYLHCWVVNCPVCGFKNPTVTQWWLVRRGDKKLYLEPEVDGNELLLCIRDEGEPPAGNVINNKVKCLKCGEFIPDEHVKREILDKDEEMLLATITLSENGREYNLPTRKELDVLIKAKKTTRELEDFIFEEELLPLGEITVDGGARTYLKDWIRLLNPRQKVLIASLTKLIREYKSLLMEDNDEEYVTAVITYLAFVIGKHLNKNCRSSRYDRRRENVIGAISPSGIPFLWDHNETNPFTTSSGSLKVVNDGILKGLDYSIGKLNESNYNVDAELSIENQSILESTLKAPVIVTNPPCLDEVNYSPLSDFYYVFENLALSKKTGSPSDTKSIDRSVNRAMISLDESFKKLYHILDDEGILIIYLSRDDFEAWDCQLSVLVKNNFRITAIWPVHIDNPINPYHMDNASLISPLIIVARKKLGSRMVNLSDVKDELNSFLQIRLAELWHYGLRGTDLTIAALGAVYDFLTQYIVYSDIDEELTFHELLTLAQNCVIDYIINKSLDYPMNLDEPTLFYLYCRLNRLNGMSMDTAKLITKTIGTDLESLEASGIIEIIIKGPGKGVKLLNFNERKKFVVEDLIDVLHYSLNIYQNKGISEFKKSLDADGYRGTKLFHLLSAFTFFEVGDPERLIALEILRESSNSSRKDDS